MGCSTSSQTSAVDTTRPSAKPDESNGASTTGVASENGNIAEDSETIPDQTPAEGSDAKLDREPAVAAASADNTFASPPAGEESPPSAASPSAEAAAPADAPAADSPAETAASSSAEAAAPADAPAADSPAETAASSSEAAAPEQEATAATDSEPKAEEAPAPSE